MPTEEPEQPTTRQQQLSFTRHENYESWYSNNIQFKPTEWDLKMIFGEMEPHVDGTITVEQHTAIVQSWLQAKIMYYFLTIQLHAYEMSHGTIQIPSTVAPPVPMPPYGEIKDDPASQQIYEYIKKFHEEFMRGQSI